MEFDWAHTWLGDGRMPAMVEGQAQRFLCQILFPLFSALSLPYLILIYGSHHPGSDLGFNGYLVPSTLFFRVYSCYGRLMP